ncbi:hypothetical protein V7127_08225 [Bacillus sp. JJ1773]
MNQLLQKVIQKVEDIKQTFFQALISISGRNGTELINLDCIK